MDETVNVVRQQFPWVTVLPEKVNHGFAVGNNIAMRRFHADYFALVNADVVVHPDWLSSLVQVMEADPRIGVAGSKVFFGNRVLLQHTGGMLRENALSYHLGANEFDIGQYDTLRDVDYVIGAALAFRGDMARSLGYLHNGYFFYFEEADFCANARKAGYRVVYVPGAVAYHDEKHSLSGTVSRKYLVMYHRSRYLFALRNLKTDEERRTFCAAERNWQGNNVRDLTYRLLLLRSKLAHWRLLLKDPWLLKTYHAE